MKNKERESGVELLRIILIFFVVTMHYFNPQMGGGINVIPPESQWIANLMIAVSCCAVNCFILISGYFMITNNKRSISKPLSLYLQLVVFTILGKTMLCILGSYSMGIKNILTCLIPTNYFIVLYLVLYIVSPYLNLILMQLSKKAYTTFILLAVFIFSIYPFLMDILGEFNGQTILGTSTIGMYGSQRGYSIVNFLLLYSIGGYIRRFEIDRCLGVQRSMLLSIVSMGVIFLFILAEGGLHLEGEHVATSYLNPVVIMSAVSMFCVFKNLHFYNGIINKLAGSVLTCFLMQGFILQLVNVEKFASGSLFMLIIHLLISFAIILCTSFVLFQLWSLINKMIFKKIDKYSINYGID